LGLPWRLVAEASAEWPTHRSAWVYGTRLCWQFHVRIAPQHVL